MTLAPCPRCGARQRLEELPRQGFFELVCWNGHTTAYRSPDGEETTVNTRPALLSTREWAVAMLGDAIADLIERDLSEGTYGPWSDTHTD